MGGSVAAAAAAVSNYRFDSDELRVLPAPVEVKK